LKKSFAIFYALFLAIWARSCIQNGFDVSVYTPERFLCKRIGLRASFVEHDFRKLLVYKSGFHVYQGGFHVYDFGFQCYHYCLQYLGLLLTTTIVLEIAVQHKRVCAFSASTPKQAAAASATSSKNSARRKSFAVLLTRITWFCSATII
jgi:hypothetical protein